MKECIEVVCFNFGGIKNKSIFGVIINKLNVFVDEVGCICFDLLEIFDDVDYVK